MKITIRNCNSIDIAEVGLELGRLNIKYGPNGTGKSTIAKAIELRAKADPNLMPLMPFKYRGLKLGEQPAPSVEGTEHFSLVGIFNEDYINQFVFKQDEIVKNSFEIFIRNADYDNKMLEIEELVQEIKKTFEHSHEIETVIKDLGELSDSFGKSQSGFSKAGRIAKGLLNGNKLQHIPEKLGAYTAFIKSDENLSWIGWQVAGNKFLNISSDCPYCTSPAEDKRETILAVEKEYDTKSIEHLLALEKIIAKLSIYFSEDTLVNIQTIVSNEAYPKKEEIVFLVGVKAQVDTLRAKLTDIKEISFFSLRDVEKVQKRIEDLIIDLAMLPALAAKETSAIVEKVNLCLKEVLAKAGNLQGEINKQKKGIESAIKKYSEEINVFLRYAGYKYSVHMEAEGHSYKMKLRHHDFAEDIPNGALHLSYGERNAFALVLFMYECLTKNPELIVLDDPISSFDKNKKFAILEMLFRGKNSFQGKTVLMLTHDIEPLIDLVKSLGRTFNPPPAAYFLSSHAGNVSETKITKDDIQSFSQICVENIAKLEEDIIKVIYLRRHYEILNSKGNEYELLSNLLHERPVPLILEADGVEREMSHVEIEEGTSKIVEMLATFDYAELLARLANKATMVSLYKASNNNYEKLQLFRLLNGEALNVNVLKKYVNEVFHIENEYIMQLNPHRYDFIPEHIIQECDLILEAK